jgi:endonuclease YncB( thermonuclease family)
MTTVIQFRNRPSPKARARLVWPTVLGALLLLAAASVLLQFSSIIGRPLLSLPQIGDRSASVEPAVARYFAMCDQVRRDYCVIDGDTFTVGGETIRIADIDAPETHPPRCEQEAKLGSQATRRLQELLNEGPFELAGWGNRDEDRYGRKLRTVSRDGLSLGAVLVSEGLAREWTGRRMPWC